MKAILKTITFNKEVETKFGTMFQYKVTYDDKIGSFLCKTKDKYPFKVNEENEFTETAQEYNGNTYYNIKAIKKQSGQSNYGRAVKKEQSKYSGFAMAYAKDLLVAGKLDSLEHMYMEAQNMIDWMVSQDKALES